MDHSQRSALRVLGLLAVGAALSLPVTVLAQETTTTSSRPKSISGTLTMDSAQVVYVSGDDVVLKDSDGLRLLALPAGTPLIVDGKPTAPKDLTPGTMLSHVRVRGAAEFEVTTVTQIEGQIFQIAPPKWVTLKLGDGTVKRYEIPKEATFQVDGKSATAFELKKGMKVSATAVTTQGVNTHAAKEAVVGETPPQMGTLLIFRSR